MRNVRRGAVAALVSVLAAVCMPAAWEQEKLVVGYSNLQSAKMPVALGKHVGLFAKHGLDVELVRVTPGNTAVPKLLSGEIQLFLGNGGPVVKAIVEEGAKLAVIASLGEDRFQLVARAPIKQAAQLKGARVGISNPNSSADRIARLTLRALGPDPDKDVRLVSTGLNESRARLDLVVKGDIDATIVDTENVKALGERSAAVTSLAELEDLSLVVSGADLSATRGFIAARRDTAKRFLAALIEAVAKAKADAELSREVYRQYANVTDAAVLEWRVGDFIQNRIPPVPLPNRKALAAYLQEAGQAGEPDLAAVADFTLLEEVARELPPSAR